MTWGTALAAVCCTALTGCVVGDRGLAREIVAAVEDAGASGNELPMTLPREDAVFTVERTEAGDGYVSHDLHLA